MPELPEVETISQGIKQNILGKKITNIITSNKNLRLPFPKNLSNLSNQTIVSINRRARYILINITNNQTLLIHLGMSGKILYLSQPPKTPAKHDHFVINFTDQSTIIYNDPRRFGFVDLVDTNKITQHKMIKNLGPEPLTKEFNHKYLWQKLQNKKINIKTAMMDNKIVVGVGNIYINESLFVAKISPLTPARTLSLNCLKILIKNIKNILQKAIKCGGSTLRDYVNLNGDIGNFQFDFKVYGQDNKNCYICSGKIKRIKQNGRSTFYCSNCQSS